MRKKAFTLIELVVVVVIIGILATVAFPVYQNIVEDAKSEACKTNLRALGMALEIYAMEHEVMPGSLSGLPGEYIGRAYVRLLQQTGAWRIKLAHFIIQQQEKGIAYAASFVEELAKGDIKLITCPADDTPPAQGGVSYGISSDIRGMSCKEYLKLADKLVIADADSAEFSSDADLSARHKKYSLSGIEKYSQGAKKNSSTDKLEVKKITKEIKEEKEDHPTDEGKTR